MTKHFSLSLLFWALLPLVGSCGDEALPDGIAPLDCSTCHGSKGNAAPPRSLAAIDGVIESTTYVGVGAHQSHLVDGRIRQAVSCEECHVVPTYVDDPNHVDPLPAEVTFGVLAATDGAMPSWDREVGVNCSQVYCHGATLTGGTNTAPIWTTVDKSQVACGTCHGNPPPSPHTQRVDCQNCHPGTLRPNGMIDVAGGQHIDGRLQLQTQCSGCHGSSVNSAPPVDLNGASNTDVVTVGAHQRHLEGGVVRNPISCDDCHVVPNAVDDEGHLGPAPADMTWGTLGQTDGASPAWDRDNAQCSDVYCHGATLDGGEQTEPIWTTLDGTQVACSSCHGFPPPFPHMPKTECWTCHANTVEDTGAIDLAGGFHINGVVDVSISGCSACHGSDVNPAPPTSLEGETETTMTVVGAHQSHLLGGTIAQPTACEECHVVPTALDDPGHIDDSPAELTWGTLATTDGAVPAWDRTTDTCSEVYCHGATLSGGDNTTPLWTTVDDTQDHCGACHGIPPNAPHPSSTACADCHAGTVDDQHVIDVAGGLHVNGIVEVEVNAPCDTCHGAPPATGSHLLHFGATPADATYGGLGATSDMLQPNTSVYAFDCGNCHPMDATHHLNGVPNSGGGVAEVELDPSTATAGSLRALHGASASYTPGTTLQTDADGFAYTEGGSCSEVYCHSGKSVSVPGPVPEPGVTFTSTGYPVVYPAFTVDVTRDYVEPVWGTSGTTCSSCHGFPPRTFCEPDTNGDCTSVDAAAGDSHSWINAAGDEDLHGWSHGFEPIPCTTCHADTVFVLGNTSRSAAGWGVYEDVPIARTVNHVNGRADVAFTNKAIPIIDDFTLGSATYDGTTQTCADVSCHLNQTEAVWGTPYRFDNVIECDACHQK